MFFRVFFFDVFLERQKTSFFCDFWDFQRHPSRFLPILGWFWVPVGSFFRWFFRTWFCSHFSSKFFQKMQKLKKWKSSSGPVKYDVSWGSPGWKQEALAWKSQCFFQCFFSKKWRKFDKKSEKNSISDKNRHNSFPWITFLTPGSILSRFWAPLGLLFRTFFGTCSQKLGAISPIGCSWVSVECSRVDFTSILGHFGGI